MNEFEIYAVRELLLALEKICDMAEYYDEVAKVKTTAHHLACAFTSFVFNELDGKVWAEPLEDALKDATLLKDGHFHNREHYCQFSQTFAETHFKVGELAGEKTDGGKEDGKD